MIDYQIRREAHWIVSKAIRRGVLTKQPCAECGFSENDGMPVQAHHTDYTKPLEVVWLCFLHHRKEHYPNMVVDQKRLLDFIESRKNRNFKDGVMHELYCFACDYKWLPRGALRPKRCPGCQSRKWDKEKE